MKRLIVLLGSLIRNLKDWRGQHGTVSFNTQPRKRTFRNKQSSSKSPSPAPIAQSTNDSSLDESFLAQLQIPNPSEFDMSLEALLNVLTSYEGNNESALNLNLGALSVGAPISDILFATSADAEQTVPWESYTTFFSDPSMSSTSSQITSAANQAAFSGAQMEVDLPSMDMSMYQMDITPLDTPALSRGSKMSIEPSASSRDEYDCAIAVDQQPPFSGLGLNIAAPQGTHVQADGIPDEELQELLNMVLSSSTSAPSMTASPSVATPMDIATPHMFAYQQPMDLTATPASMPLTLTPRAVAAVSKRGKGRTTAAIRRDLNKQLRQNPVESVVSSPGSISVTPAPLPLAEGAAKKAKKMRASDATVKARQETLERAKEWREVMAKELERARTARWEVMMEGLVLREIGVLVRNEGSASAIEIDK